MRNLANQLTRDARFVRTDKASRYALADWGLEEYSGIADEIVQRIERGGGIASRAAIVEEFTSQFGVSESSIDAYLKLPLFALGGDEVRLGDPTRFSPSPPQTIASAFRTGHGWAERFEVTVEALRGYSYALSAHIAWANGIRPTDDLIVPVHGSSATASIIWRVTSVNGRVDIGHLRQVLQERDLKPGDPILICPTRDYVFVFAGVHEVDQAIHAGENQATLPDSMQERWDALG